MSSRQRSELEQRLQQQLTDDNKQQQQRRNQFNGLETFDGGFGRVASGTSNQSSNKGPHDHICDQDDDSFLKELECEPSNDIASPSTNGFAPISSQSNVQHVNSSQIGASGTSTTVRVDPNQRPTIQFISPALQTQSEMSSANQYQEVEMIGSGAYGTVYKARDLLNEGQMVALKKVRIPLNDEGVPINLIREIALLKSIENMEHPNIVRLLDICHGSRMESERALILFLVFEHVDQDLASYLESCPSPGLGPDRIKDIMYQILNGLDFLHSNRIVHRDLKPQNILITSQGQVKLADFGLARIYANANILTTVVVTLWYRAPEVLLKLDYCSAVDLWSCGCIFAELHLRKPLFCGQSESDQLHKIFSIMGPPSENEWPRNIPVSLDSFSCYRRSLDSFISEMEDDAKDILEKMLTFNANKRISASTALKHRYFKDYLLYPPIYASCSSSNSSKVSSSSPSTSNSAIHMNSTANFGATSDSNSNSFF